ncbi:hypothetical protein [Streptomyces neyagawaensis]|uniref:hypothetical protein n=1 Tax=Streptomyces neyagawaensis TaxID=42238 RepID=UPI0006E31532|nr:hypothetical protein [Streptomyces neyagawaensis]MCL6735215.1 hypothetical protein [Streptomyces neyagawaensis]MDE1688498.1 hypothetical protein [Streptomyces neyagawaensis]
MLNKRGTVGLISAAAAVVGVLSAAAPAGAAAGSTQASTAQGKHCVVVVGKAPSDGGVSPELYRNCADTAAKARALLASPQARAATGGRAVQSTLLMTWYSDDQLRGNSTNVFGSSGTCDSSGYRLSLDSYWSANISSAAGWGQCKAATFHNRALTYAASFTLAARNLGPILNDNVGLIDVYQR